MTAALLLLSLLWTRVFLCPNEVPYYFQFAVAVLASFLLFNQYLLKVVNISEAIGVILVTQPRRLSEAARWSPSAMSRASSHSCDDLRDRSAIGRMRTTPNLRACAQLPTSAHVWQLQELLVS